jgi:hypothetical protein
MSMKTTNEVTDAQWAQMTNSPKINRTAQRRAHAAERGSLIAFLGWSPEDGTADTRYAATTGELLKWARENGWRG